MSSVGGIAPPGYTASSARSRRRWAACRIANQTSSATSPTGSGERAGDQQHAGADLEDAAGVVERVARRPAGATSSSLALAAGAAVGEQLDGDRRVARAALDAAQVALGGGDLAGDEAQPLADARRSGSTSWPCASWRSRLRRSVRASFSRSWTETTAPVMSCEPWVRSRTLPTRGEPAQRALQAPLGHAQLELAARARGDLRGDDVAAEVVGDCDDLRGGAVDVARRRGDHDLRGALDVAAGAAVGVRAPGAAARAAAGAIAAGSGAAVPPAPASSAAEGADCVRGAAGAPRRSGRLGGASSVAAADGAAGAAAAGARLVGRRRRASTWRSRRRAAPTRRRRARGA